MPEPLHSRLVEALSLPVCLRKVGCDEVVLGAQYSAYKFDKLGKQLLSVAAQDLLRSAVRIYSVLKKRSGRCCGCSIPEWDTSCHSGQPVGCDQNKDTRLCGFSKRAE